MRALSRPLARHRRLIAALLAAASVACALLAVRQPPGVAVLAAARDLPGGRVSAPDVTVVRLPPDAVPDGAFNEKASIVGRVLSGPVRRGELLTDVRLLGRGFLSALGSGLVATPVRIADADAATLLSPGDVVDVLAAFRQEAAQAITVAREVTVVTRPATGSVEGALLVLATTSEQAIALARAQSSSRLSVTVHAR
ncbi:SAF domain-containing protein [Microtetraspora sp. NBRC 16547]|uniref:SAF domain-containing protein n=1 Tax=Microtetraspora sp. NBRC 16547 TaxID=3030993 RepID=UPI0024A1A8BF|nr:SAF domain-containing protein [Microtetraspora sp. NBRC 16547]GLX02178.1 flagellar basal body P-ring biosynthesis protein [Microtetraspora sp. NBRC 16547]